MKEVKSPKKPLIFYYGIVLVVLILVCEDDLRIIHLYFTNIFLIDHLHKCSVIYFLDLYLHQKRINKHIKNQKNDQHDPIL